MAVPTLADTWKVTYKYHSGATKFENVVHVTAPIPTTPQLIADQAAAAWMASGSLFTMWSSQTFGDNIEVQPYDGATAPYDLSSSAYTGHNGTSSPPSVPAQVCMLATLRTGFSGRSSRGRIYLGGTSSSRVDTTGALWLGAAMTNIQTAFDNWHSSLVGGADIVDLVVYSQLHNSKHAVSVIAARQYFGTQRRRAEQAEP